MHRVCHAPEVGCFVDKNLVYVTSIVNGAKLLWGCFVEYTRRQNGMAIVDATELLIVGGRAMLID